MFLEIRGIRKSFGEGDSLVEVLKGIDLSVEKGEFCVLLGPSGSDYGSLPGRNHRQYDRRVPVYAEYTGFGDGQQV